jgi:hypothetical protein
MGNGEPGGQKSEVRGRRSEVGVRRELRAWGIGQGAGCERQKKDDKKADSEVFSHFDIRYFPISSGFDNCITSIHDSF